MPEIKQPEQLKLDLDTNTRLFINIEKLRNDIAMYDFNVLAFDAALVAGAPQPLGRPGQRVNPLQDRFDAWAQEVMQAPIRRPAMIEIHVGRQLENP